MLEKLLFNCLTIKNYRLGVYWSKDLVKRRCFQERIIDLLSVSSYRVIADTLIIFQDTGSKIWVNHINSSYKVFPVNSDVIVLDLNEETQLSLQYLESGLLPGGRIYFY